MKKLIILPAAFIAIFAISCKKTTDPNELTAPANLKTTAPGTRSGVTARVMAPKTDEIMQQPGTTVYYGLGGYHPEGGLGCVAADAMCHITKPPIAGTDFPAGPHVGHWVNSDNLTAIRLNKSDEDAMHFYNATISDGKYTVKVPYNFAIFDNPDATDPSSLFRIEAGAYDVMEDDNTFIIIFKSTL